MILPDETLDGFIALYRRVRGRTLDRAEAREMVERVLALYELLASPPPRPEDRARTEDGPAPSARDGADARERRKT